MSKNGSRTRLAADSDRTQLTIVTRDLSFLPFFNKVRGIRDLLEIQSQMIQQSSYPQALHPRWTTHETVLI